MTISRSALCRYIRYVAVLTVVGVGLAAKAAEPSDVDYEKNKNSKGMLLLTVDWFRQHSCGPYKSAELARLRLGPTAGANGTVVTLERPPGRFRKLQYVDYAFLVDPGSYAMAGSRVSVVTAAGQTRHLKNRTQKGAAVTHTGVDIAVGEAVFIGVFTLDCRTAPKLVRMDFGAATEVHLEAIRNKYPFLGKNAVKFRPFDVND